LRQIAISASNPLLSGAVSPIGQDVGLFIIRSNHHFGNSSAIRRMRHAPTAMLVVCARYFGQPGFSPSPLARSVIRNTSNTTAVDQPNNSTPFIAAMGPSKCQRSTGVTSP
jgi:hypothetical protein